MVRVALFVGSLLIANGAFAQSAVPPSGVLDSRRLVDDLRTLSADAMAGRSTDSPGAEMARRFIADRFRAVGLEPIGSGYEHPFEWTGPGRGGRFRGVNVVGRVTGRTTPHRYLVVSAHYDHLGIRNGRVFNGANDNASGAAALSVMAAYFLRHRPNQSILFVAFDAEEAGLRGSQAFVANPPVPADRLVANVNLDMIGRDASDTLWIAGVRRFPVFRPGVTRTAASAPVRVRMGYDDPAGPGQDDWTRQSDQFSFITAGIPALYVGVEDFALYHHPDDDFETMKLPFYVSAVETIIALLADLDGSL